MRPVKLAKNFCTCSPAFYYGRSDLKTTQWMLIFISELCLYIFHGAPPLEATDVHVPKDVLHTSALKQSLVFLGPGWPGTWRVGRAQRRDHTLHSPANIDQSSSYLVPIQNSVSSKSILVENIGWWSNVNVKVGVVYQSIEDLANNFHSWPF